MAQTCQIAVIGGGASGLIAAIAAARLADGVKIFERCDRVGKKLLATGNGRCNLTNTGDLRAHTHGDVRFVSRVLERFDAARTTAFFEELGVRCKAEEDRVYPYSEQASAVLDVLRLECARLGVEEVCGFEASSLRPYGDSLMLVEKGGEVVHARRAIVAAGGCASPALGSNGTGYDLLRALGHTVSPLYPALTPIKTRTDEIKSLRGIRFSGGVAVSAGGRVVARESGEVLFTEYGLSGIAIFNLSTATGEAFARGSGDVEIVLDLLEELSPSDCAKLLFSRACALSQRPLEHFFTGLLNKRIGAVLFKIAGVPAENRVCADLTPAELRRLADLMKDWRIPAVANMGFSNAQVTAGGALTEEFDPDTLASRLAPNIFAAGEVFDVHGDCGGFNLQWAWATGFLAGEAAAMSLAE